jgi:ABC-type phosphate transport system permease subunit
MPFGLTHMLASFQAMMKDIYNDLLDKGVVLTIYVIPIFTKITDQHNNLVEEVLDRSAKNLLVL